VILLGDGGRRGMEIRSEPAEVGHHALGGQRLEAAHGLGGIGFVVQEDELDRHFLSRDSDATRRVQVLDGDLVARPDLRAPGSVAARERDDGADLDRLRPRGERAQAKARENEECENPHRVPPDGGLATQRNLAKTYG
jgi:hypothetical protein